eukprot:1854703-Rhodomonas_salina.1
MEVEAPVVCYSQLRRSRIRGSEPVRSRDRLPSEPSSGSLLCADDADRGMGGQCCVRPHVGEP